MWIGFLSAVFFSHNQHTYNHMLNYIYRIFLTEKEEMYVVFMVVVLRIF